MTSYEFCSLILQGLGATLAAVTLGVAIWGLNTWKKEHVGKRKLELLEKLYPHLKTIEINLPLIFRTHTTDYETECIKKNATGKGSKIKDNYDVMDCIDYRMQNTFSKHFRVLQGCSYFADIFLTEELKKTYYALAHLNHYFPIEYHSKSVKEIEKYQKILQEHTKSLTEYFIDEIKKAA